MLTIGKLGSGQEAYYLEKVAAGAEDYYSGEGEAEGQWTGDAAAELALEADVGADQLTAMLTGNHPASGEPLVGSAGVPGRGAVPGFDLTFSAPKSVSLLWALGDPETRAAALAAHERSIEAALSYMQREACWTRRGKGGATFVEGNGYLAAAFRHRSSRAGDSQLHTHVLIANATKGPDGRWTRLHHPSIYHHQKTAGYLYEAQLRHELSRSLGVRWQQVRNGIAEIAGFTDRQLRFFSTRRAEILAAAGGPEASQVRRINELFAEKLAGAALEAIDELKGLARQPAQGQLTHETKLKIIREILDRAAPTKADGSPLANLSDDDLIAAAVALAKQVENGRDRAST